MNQRKRLLIGVIAAALSSRVLADEPHSHPAVGEDLGQVDFPVSCNAAAQKEFNRAVATLHSFWYEAAEKSFRAVSDADPGCAMAYWGIAMSLYHPIWPDV